MGEWERFDPSKMYTFYGANDAIAVPDYVATKVYVTSGKFIHGKMMGVQFY